MRNARVPATLEHMSERDEVVADIRIGIDERIADTRLCSEVDDVREHVLRKQPLARRGLGEIHGRECELRSRREFSEPRLLQLHIVVRIKVIDTSYTNPRIAQSARDVHADETCRTGDENMLAQFYLHHGCRAVRSSARSFACFRKLANAPIAMCAKPGAPSRKPSFST